MSIENNPPKLFPALFFSGAIELFGNARLCIRESLNR